jgi:hypothetical protein
MGPRATRAVAGCEAVDMLSEAGCAAGWKPGRAANDMCCAAAFHMLPLVAQHMLWCGCLQWHPAQYVARRCWCRPFGVALGVWLNMMSAGQLRLRSPGVVM